MMNVGNIGAGFHNVVPDIGNDGMGDRDINMCIYCKSLLEVKSQRCPPLE